MHILERACSEMQSLRDSFPDVASMTLAVNLSCKQFANSNLVNRISQIIDATGFPATRLKLEITESVFFESPEKAIEMLEQLRELGVDINIDDFGTGYSNLNYLRKLPVSTLKIDRSFILPIDAGGRNTEIVETITMLARSLNLKVIAEGVENENQLVELRRLNCEGAQGNYFSPPMTIDEVREFLSDDIRRMIPKTQLDEITFSTLQ